MAQALYRKYRSRTLDEIGGQEHITRTLGRAIKNGTVSHAYLFTGPRGVGKTSIARILAHEINGLPYTDESTHLDIIEIDAASNRRIDEIRDLRDKVHIAPTSAKYKVYIIDEVHMLTREAFNALLKTLEEPPAHVVFILATTELHKLPETIISRTQRYTFKPINVDTAVSHLENIAKAEGIKIDKEALKLLAEHGRGSFRDSISLLDQVGGSAKLISADDVRSLIGLAPTEHITRMLEAVLTSDPRNIVSALNDCVADGVSPAQVAKQLSEVLRTRIVSSKRSEAETLINLLGDLINVPASAEPASALEIALFKAQLSALPVQAQNPVAAMVATSPAVEQLASPKPVAKKLAQTEVLKPKEPAESVEEKPTAETKQPQPVGGDPAEWWNDVLQHIKSVNNTLYGVLRMAEPRIDNDTLHLSFGFGFHKKKAADSDTQAKIHEAITKVTGNSYVINAVHDKNLTKAAIPTSAQELPKVSLPEIEIENSELSSISDIFGGAEVLES